ncbi:MAG: preprotein translocase subunit YajC [Rhizomicrobium sp.]
MQDSFVTTLIPLIAVFAIFYFLIIRPQQQRVKHLRDMVDNVRRGDTVVTAGGIVGRVAKVPQKDDPEITVEIADNVQVRVLRSTLSEVRAKNSDAKTDKS